MRIAHLITRLIIGGAQENTLFNVQDQHYRHGDDVCLITGPATGPEGTLMDQAERLNLDIRLLPDLQRNINPLRDARAYFAVKQLFREYQPDLVHTHSSKAGIVGRRAAHALGIPCVHSIHGAAFHEGQSAALYYTSRFAEKCAGHWCQHFITVCDAMARQYLAAGIGTPEKYTTVYSGMNVDRFLCPSAPPNAVRRQLGLTSDDVVVVKVARLFNLKGHEYLIEAAPKIVAAIPKLKFVLVGDGILRSKFEVRIAELGLSDHFIFAGLVPPDDVTNYIHAADLVAHTSVWEGLARVLPQGLIAGKPVVSFDIDGATEVCVHRETGLLVPARNLVALADAVITLASDERMRQKFGEEGRRRFTEQFRHEFMTECIRKVYRRVLDQKERVSLSDE